jgi:hypothetical protein
LVLAGIFTLQKTLSQTAMTTQMSPWMEKLIDKTIQMLQNDILKKKIQILILQPFLQYMIELIFPYVILVCVVFGLMILMMMSILIVLLYKVPVTSAGPSMF